MSPWFLPYDLQDGYIHNWLVAGPLIVPNEDPGAPPGAGEPAPAAAWSEDSNVTATPMERAKFAVSVPGGSTATLTWDYRRVEGDHLLDMAGSHPAGSTLRAWAYAELVSAGARRVRLVLHSFGPAQISVNGQVSRRADAFMSRSQTSM